MSPSTCALVLSSAAVVVGAACGASGAAPVEPTPVATTSPPAGAGAEVGPFDTDAAIDYDTYDEAFSADLDGDGRPESIAFDCEAQTVRVGAVEVAAPLFVHELNGCHAAVLQLRTGAPARQLLVTAYDHDEIGPPRHVLYAYAADGLDLIWADNGMLWVLPSGRWITASSDCDEDAGIATTTYVSMAWDGLTVSSDAQPYETPVGPGDCAEP